MASIKKSEFQEIGLINDGDILDIVTKASTRGITISSINEINDKYGYLNDCKTGVVIRDVLAQSVFSKVADVEGDYFKSNNFSSLVSSQAFFGQDYNLNSNWVGFSMSQDNINQFVS